MNARPTPRRRRRLVPLLLLAALLGGIGWYVKAQVFTEASPTVMSAPVTRGDLEQTVLATGILKPVKLVAVGAQVSGQITALDVRLGQEVKEGDLVAEIDSVTQENALRTAQAQLANVRAQKAEAQATLKLARSTLARQQKMVKARTGSQADLDSAEADVSTAGAQIAALEAQIEEAEVAVSTAQANLDYTRITAPMDGTVLAIVSQQGQTVNAAQSTPTIVILGQLDTMTVRAEISEADIVNVHPGQPVYFTVLGDPGTRYDATLASIEPAPESITSDSAISSSTSASSGSASSSSSAIYYNGIFDVPNPEGRLRTYMTAEVHIVLGAADDALLVPSSALSGSAAGGYSVRVLGPGGGIESRSVEVGLNNKIRAEITSGLREGERVVTSELTSASAITQGRRGPPMGL
ncbi:efflux RND transporter periplasmic adaptor subunit (plasmid) [Paroceanicella profunda]|uniref:Efflux RND transporter periplasmic adaptor subunit n=1 Tax=Paroceanicella profunda TaxID=2579971 RepID=A0A5B8G1P1_9RHOB|nr:efflux RND transporter periplasmic adaptor subunit [Paroceanicella profunda]QDL93800.1 efflux RND transporter periplasmic adaptor subunit [Paroceanicella profunda]